MERRSSRTVHTHIRCLGIFADGVVRTELNPEKDSHQIVFLPLNLSARAFAFRL